MSESVRVRGKKSEAAKEDKTSNARKSNYLQPANSSINRILLLQKTIGNQAVGRLIKSGALQAKLRIGQSDDIYEQEANRVAGQVMRMPESQIVSCNNFHIQRACPKCEENELKRQPIKEEEEEEKLQRQPVEEEEEKEKFQAKTASSLNHEIDPGIENHIQSMKGGGNPLSESERAFFEPRFGHDFSQVRVHTDAMAAETAQAVGARAFTVGRDVVFGAGEYSEGTGNGKELLAHELTHVIQQNRDCSAPALLKFAPTVYHPGTMHNHMPTYRWADVQNASSCIRGTVECVCRHAQPLGVLMMAYLHKLENLARRHLIHYVRGGGADLPVNLEDVIRRDVGVRAPLAAAMRSSNRGWVTIQQSHYDVQDFQYAFGAIDRLDFEVDSAAGLVHLWFKDRYEYHPVGFGYTLLPGDILRETNCVHAAAVELKDSGAADYWMVGDAIVPLHLFRGPFTYSIGTSERQERQVL